MSDAYTLQSEVTIRRGGSIISIGFDPDDHRLDLVLETHLDLRAALPSELLD
jgi:hypothetical protein